jgi:hypothetical protein
MLNGVATPVVFNDGDSFRVLGGPLTGAKARLSGFNTLESHGAVHQWGDWTAKEMYILAKLATHNARDNVWECTSDGKTDGYGRMLVFCPGLAKEQIRLGLAHAMSIDDTPADAELLAAQREAIAARAASGPTASLSTSSPPALDPRRTSRATASTTASSRARTATRSSGSTTSSTTSAKTSVTVVYKVDEARVTEVADRLRREQPRSSPASTRPTSPSSATSPSTATSPPRPAPPSRARSRRCSSAGPPGEFGAGQPATSPA